MSDKTQEKKLLPLNYEELCKMIKSNNLDEILSDFKFSYDADPEACGSLSSIFMFLSVIFRYPSDEIYNTIKENSPTFRDFFDEYSDKSFILPPKNELETEYVKLFVANIGGIPAPLYASVYTDSEKLVKRESTVNLQKVMAATGFAIEDDTKELEDNLYIMLEYLSHLFLALSEDTADENENLKYLHAVINVTNNYIKPMFPEFHDKIEEYSEIDFYKEAATILYNFIDDIDNVYCEVLNI